MYEHMRGLREDKDLSQEQGRVNIPVSALCRLAEFYHTSIDYLVGLTDERRAYPRRKA